MPENRPLLTGQFVWAVSNKDGSAVVIVGPDPLVTSTEDTFFIPDPQNPGALKKVENAVEAVQNFVTLKAGEYAVIHNPASSVSPNNPNGGFKKGRNELVALDYGQKRIVTKGHFPVWPGQQVEIRPVHTLSASEYLLVEVEGPVDDQAPYYAVTAAAAGLRKAVFEPTVTKLSEGTDKPSEGTDKPPEGNEAGQGSSKSPEGKAPEASGPPQFVTGQRIVIRGSETPTYVPPTGIEVVLEEEVQAAQPAVKADAFKSPTELLREQMESGEIRPDDVLRKIQQKGWESYVRRIREAYTDLKAQSARPRNFYKALVDQLPPDDLEELASELCGSGTEEVAGSAAIINKDTGVRQALVPGPAEFVTIIDQEGNPDTKAGPGRVFPGPNDRFETAGSRGGIYDAYHVRQDRGILLRVTATEITKKDLAAMLPEGCELEKDRYTKGEEIFVGGIDAYIVPTRSFQVINPVTRQPHMGNDHSEVYVTAIGVDQKSGVYASDVQTGNVELVRGETKFLPDPRKQRHVKRQIPGWFWNLAIGEHEPHKKVPDGKMVDTPWAMSIPIPNNAAVLITGRNSRRVAVGPRTELLEFEELLEVMRLSKGRPKNDTDVVETCFLQVQGNRVTDQIDLITKEFVTVQVQVSYGVEFVGESDEERQKWFNHRDYVLFFCEHLRSRLRAAARLITLDELYKGTAEFVRDIVLGKKPEGDDQHRPGMLFKENNMRVIEVEVLEVVIPDAKVAAKLAEINGTIATQQLNDALAAVQLDSARKQDALEAAKAELALVKTKRDAATKVDTARVTEEADAEAAKITAAAAARKAAEGLATAQLTEETAAKQGEITLAKAKREAATKVDTARVTEEAAAQATEIELAELKRELKLALEKVDAEIQKNGKELEAKKQQQVAEQALAQERLTGVNALATMGVEQNNREAAAELERVKAKNAALVEFREKLAAIDKDMATAIAAADKTRLEGVSAKLVAALEGLGNKELMTALAEHLPVASGSIGLLTGLGGMEALKKLTAGTPFERALEALSPKKPGEGEVPEE